MTLRCERIGLSRPAGTGLDDINLELRPGEVHALLGPNGSGKTSLLRIASGELRPGRGRCTIAERGLEHFSAPELARHRAVLQQHDVLAFGFPAEQVVALGRLAWPDRGDGPAARAQIEQAMRLTGTAHLADRPYTRLSGGERRRVQLARALAQLGVADPAPTPDRYLLLDEPTAHLDLPSIQRVTRVLRAMTSRRIGVLLVLHDPNLAVRHAQRVSLMRDGRLLAAGIARSALDEAALTAVYGVPIRSAPGPDGFPMFMAGDEEPGQAGAESHNFAAT